MQRKQRWAYLLRKPVRDQRGSPSRLCWVLQVQNQAMRQGAPPPLRNHCRGLRAHSASLTSTHTPHHTDTHTETQTHALHADTHYTQTHYTQLTRSKVLRQLRKACTLEGEQSVAARSCLLLQDSLQEKNKTKQNRRSTGHLADPSGLPERKEAAVHRARRPQPEGRSLTGEAGPDARRAVPPAPPRCFPGQPSRSMSLSNAAQQLQRASRRGGAAARPPACCTALAQVAPGSSSLQPLISRLASPSRRTNSFQRDGGIVVHHRVQGRGSAAGRQRAVSLELRPPPGSSSPSPQPGARPPTSPAGARVPREDE